MDSDKLRGKSNMNICYYTFQIEHMEPISLPKVNENYITSVTLLSYAFIMKLLFL